MTDIADNAVSGRTQVIVHRSLVYPGIKSNRYVGQAEDDPGPEVQEPAVERMLERDHAKRVLG